MSLKSRLLASASPAAILRATMAWRIRSRPAAEIVVS